jgi:V/A-type H+-transporting ATPase subunit D
LTVMLNEQVSSTRSELLARRARIGFASQGRDLLKERRTALVREFHRLGASALDSLAALDRDAADANRFLGLSVAADGPEPVHSAALAAQGDVEVTVRTRNVAGVPIVEIEKGVPWSSRYDGSRTRSHARRVG